MLGTKIGAGGTRHDATRADDQPLEVQIVQDAGGVRL
jgi:hypothetical protein